MYIPMLGIEHLLERAVVIVGPRAGEGESACTLETC